VLCKQFLWKTKLSSCLCPWKLGCYHGTSIRAGTLDHREKVAQWQHGLSQQCLRNCSLSSRLPSLWEGETWNQPWIFTGRTDAEVEAPIFWPPDVKSWLTGKDPDAGKDWRQEETGVTEDEMSAWYHWLNGHEFEQTLGDSERQGSLICCSPGVAKSRTWLSSWTTMFVSHSVTQSST